MDLNEEKSDEKLFEPSNSNEHSIKANLLETNNVEKSQESFKNKKIGKITKSFLDNKSISESNNQSPFHTPSTTFRPFPKGLSLDNLEFKLEYSKNSEKYINNKNKPNVPVKEVGIVSPVVEEIEEVKDKICDENIHFINSFEEKKNIGNNTMLSNVQNSQMELAIFVVLYISDDFLKKKFSQFIIGNNSNTSTKTTYNDSIIGKDFKEPIIIKEKFILKVTDIFKNLINLFLQRFNLKLLEYGLKLLDLDEIEEIKRLTNRDLSYSIKNLKKSMKPDIDLPSFDQSTEIGVFKIDNFSLVYSPDLLIMPHSTMPKLSFAEEVIKLPVTKSQVYSEDSSSSSLSNSDDSKSSNNENNKENTHLKERRKLNQNDYYYHDKYEIDNLKANNKNLEDSGITLKLNNSSSTNKIITKEKDSTAGKNDFKNSANKSARDNNPILSSGKKDNKNNINGNFDAEKNKLNRRLVFEDTIDSKNKDSNSLIKTNSKNDGCCSKCIVF